MSRRSEEADGASIRHLLLALGEPVLEVLAAPGGLDVAVRDVTIFDSEDELEARAGDLVLLVGVRGRAAIAPLRVAARHGAAAVAAKLDDRSGTARLREAAQVEGVALLGVGSAVRWEQLQSLVRGVLDSARVVSDAEDGDDLFALAQTVATLTGGIVSIEDPSYRVLAYSRAASDEVDELRRMSILGRKGPEAYLRLLREWGIYQRLRAGTAAVRVAERPDLGIRERLAIGVHAGPQFLGTIWVQEGSEPLRPQAERELRGAAVLAARHLVSLRTERSHASRLEERLLRGLLERPDDGAAIAAQLGLDAQVRCAVVAFGLGDPDHPADPAEAELHRGRLMTLVALSAAAFRRSAVVTMIGTRVYALLPDLEAPDVDAAVLALIREIVSSAAGHLGVRVRAGLGHTVPGVGEIPESRRESDQVLSALAWHAESVATLNDVRGEVLLADVLDRLASDGWTGDQRFSALTDHDAAHGTRLAASLLAYLDAFGDVGAAAGVLHVHPNTLRYRVRQATRLTGLNLADPHERLVAALCLHRDRVR